MKTKLKYYIQAVIHRYYMGEWPQKQKPDYKKILDSHIMKKDSIPRRG